MRKKKTWGDAAVVAATAAARSVFQELELVHPTDTSIETLAFMRGALVRDISLRGCLGRLTSVGSSAIISVSAEVTYPPRRRFVIAHELGHLEIHRGEDQLQACASNDIGKVYSEGVEREANAFATEFLMPEHLWKAHVDVREPNLDIVKSLANDYEVSFVAAAIRFAKLSPERLALVFSTDGKQRWSAHSETFGLWIERDQDLDPYTLAYDFFAKGKVTSLPELVSASAWVDSRRITDEHHLVEHCCPIRSIGATLSLLWVPVDSGF